jgi:hypothetical protein
MVASRNQIEAALRQASESRRNLATLARRINGSVVTLRRVDPFGDPREQARDFIENLDWRLPDDLAEMGEKYRAVPAQISRTVAAALDGPANLFGAYVLMTEHVIGKCVDDWKRPRGPWRKTDALIRLAFRSLLVAREVFALIELGYIGAARARLRTLLELAATAALLERSEVDVTERYQADHVMELLRQFNRGDLDGKLSEGDAKLLLRRAHSAKRKFGKEIAAARGWAVPVYGRIPGVGEIVRDFGPTSFADSYSDLSHEVHAAHITSMRYEFSDWIEEYGSGPRVDAFAHTGYDCAEYLHSSVAALLASTYSGNARSDIVYWMEVLRYTSKEIQLELIQAQGAVDPAWYRETMLKVAETVGPHGFNKENDAE